jgi:hypothetical protein
MFEFDRVKLWFYYWWDHLLSSTVRGISVRGKDFVSLKIYGKLAGLSNKFEPSMVFDPSEFEGPRFDLYICKMLISIFSCFFILYLKIWLNRFYIQNATECTILRPSEKKISGGRGWQTLDPLPLLVSRGLACLSYELCNIVTFLFLTLKQ